MIDPVQSSLEAYLAVFNNLPSSIVALITLGLGLFIIIGVIKLFMR